MKLIVILDQLAVTLSNTKKSREKKIPE